MFPVVRSAGIWRERRRKRRGDSKWIQVCTTATGSFISYYTGNFIASKQLHYSWYRTSIHHCLDSISASICHIGQGPACITRHLHRLCSMYIKSCFSFIENLIEHAVESCHNKLYVCCWLRGTLSNCWLHKLLLKCKYRWVTYNLVIMLHKFC